MKSNTLTALGGLQSLFFCAGIYLVALFFSIFVCSSVFYAFNIQKQNAGTESAPTAKAAPAKRVIASLQ
jgi:hypothetical protein